MEWKPNNFHAQIPIISRVCGWRGTAGWRGTGDQPFSIEVHEQFGLEEVDFTIIVREVGEVSFTAALVGQLGWVLVSDALQQVLAWRIKLG